MRKLRMRLLAAPGVLLAAALAAAAFPAAAAGQGIPRPAFEALYTRVGYAGAAPRLASGGTVRAEGLGGRVMWPVAADDRAPWLARRAAVGLFGAYTPNPDAGFSAGQFGLAADFAPLGAPVAGRIEPFVSLGAGALHTATGVRGIVLRPTARPELPVSAAARAEPAAAARRQATHLLLVPAVGARVRLGPGMAAQGDLRNLVAFDGGARRHHPAFGAGLRLLF